METVTRYKAEDGSEWQLREDAEKRDAMVKECNSAMAYLKDQPDDLNWEGYIQQDYAAIESVKACLFQIANQDGVLKWWIDDQKNTHGKTQNQFIFNTHPSWFGRMLDGGHGPLAKAYHRLCCIDDQNREWNQLYFAINPSKGKQVCVG